MTLPNNDAPPKFWWRIKIACGAALIAIVVDQFIFHLLRDGLWLPIILGQAIAVTGGAITIYHHYILGKAGNNPALPQGLVISGGLYRVLRHPMYTGDCILYLGLFVLAAKPLGLAALLLGWLALTLQAKAEDRYLEARFGEQFNQWRQHSGLLLPGI